MKNQVARQIANLLNQAVDRAEQMGAEEIDLSIIGILDSALAASLDSLQAAIEKAEKEQAGG